MRVYTGFILQDHKIRIYCKVRNTLIIKTFLQVILKHEQFFKLRTFSGRKSAGLFFNMSIFYLYTLRKLNIHQQNLKKH